MPQTYTIAGRDTKSTQQAYLASNDFATGQSSLQGYNQAQSSAPEVIDLIISGLPQNMDLRDMKKISGARHIVDATLEEDSFKGICLGSGRI